MKNAVPDLKGAIVGISGPGSSTDMFAKIVVENTGTKREDVSYIAVGTSSAAVAALRGGSVDAVSNVDPVISELVNSGDMVLIADGRAADGAKKVYGGAPTPIVSRSLFKARHAAIFGRGNADLPEKSACR